MRVPGGANTNHFEDAVRVAALGRLGEIGDHEMAGREARWPGEVIGNYYDFDLQRPVRRSFLALVACTASIRRETPF